MEPQRAPIPFAASTADAARQPESAEAITLGRAISLRLGWAVLAPLLEGRRPIEWAPPGRDDLWLWIGPPKTRMNPLNKGLGWHRLCL